MNFASFMGNNQLSVVTMATKRKNPLFLSDFRLKKPIQNEMFSMLRSAVI